MLANPDLEPHFYKESDPDMFVSNKKLLIVFIHLKMYSLSFKLCRAYTSPPCINLLAETMLSDHSLSLALCDQCCRGWFGPMPNSEMLKNKTSLDHNPALACISCYRIASVEDYNPALAYISCYRIASVEDYNPALACIYISCYRIASVEDYNPALAYISCYRIASVEDYNPALACIYISCYRIASVEDYNPALAYISCYRIASVEDYNPALAYISCYRIASVEDYNPALAYIYVTEYIYIIAIYIYHVTE